MELHRIQLLPVSFRRALRLLRAYHLCRCRPVPYLVWLFVGDRTMTIKQSRQRLHEATEAYKATQPGRDLTDTREELTHARNEYHLECAQIVERLAKALEPFAGEADKWHATCQDDETPNIGRYPGDNNDAAFTVGDLRALAALYEEIK